MMKPVSSGQQLSRIVLEGYRSIAKCDLDLGCLNVFIGCNGAGKSNFISFFRMIQQILDGDLQLYVGREGGPDALLHFGRKTTERLMAELYFGNNGYKFQLEQPKTNKWSSLKKRFGGI